MCVAINLADPVLQLFQVCSCNSWSWPRYCLRGVRVTAGHEPIIIRYSMTL